MTTSVKSKFFLLGLSFNIINHNKRVIHIHKNDKRIETDNHNSLMIIRLKNQEIHHKAHINLFIQKAFGNHFNVLNSQ